MTLYQRGHQCRIVGQRMCLTCDCTNQWPAFRVDRKSQQQRLLVVLEAFGMISPMLVVLLRSQSCMRKGTPSQLQAERGKRGMSEQLKFSHLGREGSQKARQGHKSYQGSVLPPKSQQRPRYQYLYFMSIFFLPWPSIFVVTYNNHIGDGKR